MSGRRAIWVEDVLRDARAYIASRDDGTPGVAYLLERIGAVLGELSGDVLWMGKPRGGKL